MDASAIPGALRQVAGDKLLVNEPLAPHTSFLIGGPADCYLEADSIDLVVATVRAARQAGMPWLVLGRGSNVLVADRGVRGLVVRIQASGVRIDENGTVYAEAGCRLASLAVQTAQHGLIGLEFAVGIPGSVGGAVVMNAGAGGACVGDTLVGADVLDENGEVRRLARADMDLGYRTSRFHHVRGEVVLGAEFHFAKGDPESALARIRAFRQRRHDTQPTDAGAGSIFKNPQGSFAGRLIEQAGLKGTQHGGALISPKHGNFIVNVGGATAADVMWLIRLAQAEVERQLGIRLALEVELVGEWDAEAVK